MTKPSHRFYYEEFQQAVDVICVRIRNTGRYFNSVHPATIGGIPLAVALSNRLDLFITNEVDHTTIVTVDQLDSEEIRNKYPNNYFVAFHISKDLPETALHKLVFFRVTKEIIEYPWSSTNQRKDLYYADDQKGGPVEGIGNCETGAGEEGPDRTE